MRQLSISNKFTPREYYSLDKYLQEISKIDLISPNEEAILMKKIRQGDKKARERMISANLRFVISVAKQYQGNGLTLGDLINEGNIGLIIAAGRYDETLGFKFISYAVWWIRQSIIAAIEDHARIVRLPHNKLVLLGKLNAATCRLEQVHERKPTPEELAELMELDENKITELISKTNARYISIDQPDSDQSDFILLDLLQNNEPNPDHNILQDSTRTEILFAMTILSKRENELIRLYFGLGTNALTLEEIGERFDITKEHVGRLKQKALDKLRNCSNAPVLLSCLD